MPQPAHTIHRPTREANACCSAGPSGRTGSRPARRDPNLDSLIEPGTRGDPESPLRWTTKSTRHLARELTAMGTAISHSAVAGILRERV